MSLVEAVESFAVAQGLAVRAVLQLGDFEAIRDQADLASMPVPARHRRPGDFALFLRGAQRLPWPLFFIGGNHEPVRHLAAIPDGGRVAANCTFLGRAGHIRIDDLHLGWLSGVYSPKSLDRPLAEDRTWTHVRSADLDAFADCVAPDLLLLHDWPTGLADGMPGGRFAARPEQVGNPVARAVIERIDPALVAAGHMHLSLWRKEGRRTICCLPRVEGGQGLVACVRNATGWFFSPESGPGSPRVPRSSFDADLR